MTPRRIFWATLVVVAAAGLALLAPASPYYLPTVLAARPQYNGQPLSHWLQRLEGDADDDRQEAIYAVGVIGVRAEAAVPTLARIMVNHENRRLRNEAAFALSKMAPVSHLAVSELACAVHDPEPLVRMNAARALFNLGGAGRPACPALLKGLSDPDNHTHIELFPITVQHQIALAIGRVSAGTDDAVPALRAALQAAGTNTQRVTMIRALGEVGSAALPAAAEIRVFLDTRDSDLRLTVTDALRSIEGVAPAQPAQPVEQND